MKINADVSITHKGTTFDFFLASDEKTKVKSWQVTPGQILNPIFTSDRPLQAHIPPEREDIMRQEYFHAGMGEEYFEHGMRYYKGPCDARRKGAVLLPPRIAQATVTTTGGNVNLICLINPSFETNDTTGWTDVDAIADASADPGTEDDGDYCAKETIAAGANETFYQELQTFENLQGVEIVASGNIWVTGVGDDARIQIDDGRGTTNGNYLSGTSVAWAESTATRTIDAAATKIAIEFYSNDDGGGGMFTYVDDVQIKVAKTALAIVPFRDFMGFAGSLYAIAGYYLLKWDGSTWEVQCAFPEEPQSLEVWGSYLMIGLGFDHTWVYYDGTTFEVSTVANAEAKFFTNLSGTLWFNDSNYTIRSSTNPINGGSVSATTTIEDVNHVITCLVKHPTTLLVGLENELYEVTATDEIPRMSILTQDSGTYTCHNAFVWNSLLYVPSSNGSLYEYDIDNYTITDISPASFCPNQPDFAGRIMAISGDHRWLYVVIDYATKIEILCGHWEPILNQYGDSVTDWVWHHVGEQTLTNASGNIASTCIDGLNGAKMMHLGCVHATDKAYYMHVPVQYGDVLADANYQVMTAGAIVSPWLRGKYKYDLKTFYLADTKVNDCDATHTIVVAYQLEEDAAATTLYTVNADPGERYPWCINMSSNMVQMTYTFASADNTTSPELKSYMIGARSRPVDLGEGRLVIDGQGNAMSWGNMDTSGYHGEFPDDNKVFTKITYITENCTETNYVTCQYRIDDAAVWTTIPEKVHTSPSATLTFPDYTVGKIMRIQHTEAVPTSSSTIVYVLHYKLKPKKYRIATFTLRLAPGIRRPEGGLYSENIDQQLQFLHNIEESEEPCVIESRFYHKPLVVDLRIGEKPLTDSQHRTPEYEITCEATEIIQD